MQNSGEILPDNPVTQVFRSDNNYLCAVGVLVGTYGKARKSSNLLLEVYTIDGDARRLGHAQVNLAEVYDNSYVEVFFEAEPNSKGKDYLLRVGSNNSAPGNAAAVYVTDGADRINGHLWCSAGKKSSFGLMAKLAYGPPVAETSVPPSLEISTVTQCNLNCVHCISRETRKSVARLPEKFRGAITRWAREGKLKTAYTDFSGDIIWADQKFGGELDFLIGLSVPFHVDTNGTHLDATVADRLFASKVTSINVSIDAADDATYRRVRRGAPPLDTIFKNMEMLVHRRSAVNRSDVKLSAAFVLMRSNVAELPEFVRRVSAAGFDAVRAIHMQAYTDDVDEESLWWDKELFNVVRRRAIKLAKDLDIKLYIDREFDDRDDRVATSFCTLPWDGAYVLGNGDVLACCVPGLHMGNLHRQTMEEIWNGPKYQNLRRTVNSDQRPPACVACPFNRKTNNPLSYMPHRRIRALQ